MALLITGGMGHVGLTLARQAAAAGLEVVAQYRSSFDRAAAETLGGPVKWVRCDLSDPFAIAALAAEHRIDGCVHTAAVPNDRIARGDPWDAVQTNIGAVGALCELARRQGWRRFINVSTGSVFQKETDFTKPILEDHPTSPTSVYGCTKRAGELVTSMYRNDYGLSAATVRISFVYGPPLAPRQRDLPRGPITALLREAVLGIDIDEPAGGDFQASFTHVEDVAAGLLAAYRAESLNFDTYHLGPGRNWNTFQVVEAIRAAVPEARIEVGPGTMPWTTFNTMRGPLAGDRLRQDAGFVPSLPLEEGVRHFASWMKANIERIR